MGTLKSILGACVAVLLALGTLYRLMRPKPPAPTPAKDARDAEKRADDAIDRRTEADVRAVEERHEAEVRQAQAEHDATLRESPADTFREIVREERAKEGR